MKWMIHETTRRGTRPLSSQPSDGFDGPGRAYLWLQHEHAELMANLGRSLIVMREDGARPTVSNKGQKL